MSIYYLTPDDITVEYGVSSVPKIVVLNASGGAVNLQSHTYVLSVDTLENPENDDTQLFELGGVILDAPTGKLSFPINADQATQPPGVYYYKIQAIDQYFRTYDIQSGRFRIAKGSRGVSGLDWKADAVSGELGEVFSENNSSGLAFFAGGPVYRDDTSGITLIFSHAEEGYWELSSISAIDNTKLGGSLNSIRLKVSFDDGETLYDAGKIITGEASASPTGEFSGPIFDIDSIQNVAFCIKKDDGYLYVYYTTELKLTNDSAADNTASLCVARALYSDVMASAANRESANWYKYYNGGWGQPGINGSATDLISNYTLANIRHINGFYSRELNKYVILFANKNSSPIDSNLYYGFSEYWDNIYAIYSDDGINFSYPQKIKDFWQAGVRYFSVVGPETYKGFGSKALTVYATSGFWTNWNNVSIAKFGLSALEQDLGVQRFTEGVFEQFFRASQALDRGQLHPYIAVIHNLNEQSKRLQVSAHLTRNPLDYRLHSGWYNLLDSYSNSSTDFVIPFPNSYEDYADFKFGRDFHKLYHEYTHTFNKHRLNGSVVNQSGPTIISHAFGPLIYNSNLETQGSASLTYKNLITSSLEDLVTLNVGHPIFSSGSTASGTYIASSFIGNTYTTSNIREYRNSGILAHIEFCQTSSTSRNNSFSIIDLEGEGRGSRFLTENVLIKQTSHDGLGRIIFDINNYQLDNSEYDNLYNFLTPEHEFEFKLKALLSNDTGLTRGGGSIGVWIHTKSELGKVWSFTRNNTWEQHEVSSLSPEKIINQLCIPYNLGQRTISPQEYQSKFQCAKFLDTSIVENKNYLLNIFTEDDFSEINVKFNTINKKLKPNQDYLFNISNNVHRKNQNYVIEVFRIPIPDDKFALYYDFNMIDLTLNKMSKPLITGIENGSVMGEIYCKEFRADLSPQQLMTVFKYFNQIRGDYSSSRVGNLTGYASRSAITTSSIYEVSGGSRLNYIESANWNSVTKNSNSQIENITIIN